MTNKKEHKILRKTLSLTLAMLVSILGLPLAKPQQVSATETSDPKFLSKVTITATAKTTWDKQYNTEFYKEIINNYNNYTENSPLEIDSAEKLAAFARAVNVGGKDFDGKYVKLTAPIDLGGTHPTVTKKVDESDSSKFTLNITGTASNVWVPIGTYDEPFKGNFDGDGHEVSNMTVLGNICYSGLFGCAQEGSIQNTGVTGNVYVSSSSSSPDCYVGSLVGFSSSMSISNSYATGNVYTFASSTVAYAGGLIGYSSSSMSISNSYATGNAYASSSSRSKSAYAGSLVGFSSSGSSGSSSISNSYATGNAYASASYSSHAGGLVGYNSSNSSISNSYATGNASASSSSSFAGAGGLVGYISYSSSNSITNTYATGNAYISSSNSYSYVGGLFGRNDTKIMTNDYYYSGSTIDVGTAGKKSSYGTGLTKDQMTGTGSGRATEKMEGFKDSNNWTFQDDGNGVKYLPRLKNITYDETTNPAPRFLSPFTANDFGFKAPANLTYNGSQKVATVTSKISEISDDKITVKYYNSAGTNLTSAPTNAGTYTVKIDFVEGDNDAVWRNITAGTWKFTITKADPTIYSTSTTAAYKPGLTLGSVLPPSISGTAGSWIWSKSTAPISSAGAHYFEAKFKPTDSKNYNEVTKCILVTVSKATLQASDFKFAAPSNLEYSADYKTATITRNSVIKGMGELTVKYFTKVNGKLTPLEDSSGKLLIPTDVGTYYVGVDVSEDTNYNYAKDLTSDNWNFTITPAGLHTYKLADKSRIYLVTK